MEKSILEKKINAATIQVLQLAKDYCYNNISDNCSYIISEIKNDNPRIFVNNLRLWKKINDNKPPKVLKEIVLDLIGIYDSIYDINLYVYKSNKDVTIIEIAYYLKSSLDLDYKNTIIDDAPMIHCKLPKPIYINEQYSQKFDVNWRHGGLKHSWRMLWYSLGVV